MSTEHKRPLLAFVAVFVVAMLVVAGAARSDALRHLVQQRTVDIVAATTLDVVGEPGPESQVVVAAPEGEVSGTESVSSSSNKGTKDKASRGKTSKDKASKGAKAEKGKAAHDRSGAAKATGHAHAKAPGKAKGHAHAKAPGKAKGHAHAQPPGQAKGHGHGATNGPAKAQGKAQGHSNAKGHAKGKGKGHHKHGH